MAGFEILEEERGPGYRKTAVRFTATDGRVEDRSLGWSDCDSDENILKALRVLWEQWEQTDRPPATPTLLGRKYEAPPPPDGGDVERSAPGSRVPDVPRGTRDV